MKLLRLLLQIVKREGSHDPFLFCFFLNRGFQFLKHSQTSTCTNCNERRIFITPPNVLSLVHRRPTRTPSNFNYLDRFSKIRPFLQRSTFLHNFVQKPLPMEHGQRVYALPKVDILILVPVICIPIFTSKSLSRRASCFFIYYYHHHFSLLRLSFALQARRMFPTSSKLILLVKYKFYERKDFNQEEVMIPKLGFDSLEFLIIFERKIFDCTSIKDLKILRILWNV